MSESSVRHHCLLTGASRGIGRELAIALAPQCDRMLLVSRHLGDLEEVRQLISQVSERTQVDLLAADLTQDDDRQSVLGAASAMGRLTLLVHNAGTSHFSGFQSLSASSLETMMQLNLLTPIRLTQLLMPLMAQSQPSQVISIGSSFGYIGYPGFVGYCASKAGLRGFTEALDRELDGSGIRAKFFAPRATATDINSKAVRDLNRSLGVVEDDPKQVASIFLRFLQGDAREYRLGFPEALFSRINQLVPRLVDRAIHQQIPKIRAAMAASAVVQITKGSS